MGQKSFLKQFMFFEKFVLLVFYESGSVFVNLIVNVVDID